MEQEWFESWFDSSYYHLLYRDRSEEEAGMLASQLLQKLAPLDNSRMLDLGCGRGRFSRFLASQDYDVTGVDLSSASIDFASQFETDKLHFYVHDMRKLFRTNYYDYIFSFFTSFGYFDDRRHDEAVLGAAKKGLRCGGKFVMDFLNATHVRNNLVEEEEKTIEGVTFFIKKRTDDKFVYKNIAFEAAGKSYEFTEKVRLLTLGDFEEMFAHVGLQLIDTYGDYNLCDFDPQESRRLIMVAEEGDSTNLTTK